MIKYYNQQDVARRIKRTRKLIGMTQSEVAELLDVTENNMYRLESGKTGHTVDKLVELAQILNVSTDYLLFGKKKRLGDKKEINEKIDKILSNKSEKEITYALEVLSSVLTYTDILTA